MKSTTLELVLEIKQHEANCLALASNNQAYQFEYLQMMIKTDKLLGYETSKTKS